MNPGHTIFKQMQRLQGGTGDVRYTPVTPTKDYPFTTDEEFIKGRYPHETQDDDLVHLTPEEQAQEQINWEKNIKELLTITPNLTPEERKQVTDLNPKDWDDSTREKVGAASEQQHARGTSNVGLGIFKKAQHLAGGTGDLGYDPSYPGPVNTTGFGSGVPTRMGVGGFFNLLGSLVNPLVGQGTGKLASMAWQMYQNGASQRQVQAAVAAYQQDQSGGDTSGSDDTSGTSTTTAPKKPSTGVGIDPWGNPADPGEWWSNDFGRWITDKYGTSPGNYWNQAGPGGPPGTKGVGFNVGGGSGSPVVPGSSLSGNLGGDAVTSGSALGGERGMGTMDKNLMMKLAKGIGMEANNPALMPDPGFQIAGSVGPGQGNIVNPAALGGASSAGSSVHFNPKAQAQMGTSDLNPGHRIFMAMGKRYKKVGAKR